MNTAITLSDLNDFKADLKGFIEVTVTTAVIESEARLRAEFKADIAELRAEFKADIAELRTEMYEIRDDLKAEIAGVRTELKGDIADVCVEMYNVRDDLKADITAVRTEMSDMGDELKADIAASRNILRAEFRRGLDNLRDDLGDDIANTRTELKAEITAFRAETKQMFGAVAQMIEQINDTIYKDRKRFDKTLNKHQRLINQLWNGAARSA